MLQNFESISVIYIIKTQCKRRIEAIYYEQQLERDDSDQDEDQIPEQVKKNMYKRKERRMRSAFGMIITAILFFKIIEQAAVLNHDKYPKLMVPLSLF